MDSVEHSLLHAKCLAVNGAHPLLLGTHQTRLELTADLLDSFPIRDAERCEHVRRAARLVQCKMQANALRGSSAF